MGEKYGLLALEIDPTIEALLVIPAVDCTTTTGASGGTRSISLKMVEITIVTGVLGWKTEQTFSVGEYMKSQQWLKSCYTVES